MGYWLPSSTPYLLPYVPSHSPQSYQWFIQNSCIILLSIMALITYRVKWTWKSTRAHKADSCFLKCASLIWRTIAFILQTPAPHYCPPWSLPHFSALFNHSSCVKHSLLFYETMWLPRHPGVELNMPAHLSHFIALFKACLPLVPDLSLCRISPSLRLPFLTLSIPSAHLYTAYPYSGDSFPSFHGLLSPASAKSLVIVFNQPRL